MRQNRVKKLMREGSLALGKYVSLADPQVVEIIGIAGFDAAFIDMEHTGFDLRTVEEMIRASDLAGVTSMVRVPDNDAKLILRILDMGAEGIIVPHIEGLEGAKRAVDAVRYPAPWRSRRRRRHKSGALRSCAVERACTPVQRRDYPVRDDRGRQGNQRRRSYRSA